MSQVFPVTTIRFKFLQWKSDSVSNEKVAVLVQSENQNIIIKQILQKHK